MKKENIVYIIVKSDLIFFVRLFVSNRYSSLKMLRKSSNWLN